MKRFHVHIAVADLAESVRFYSALFGAPPNVAKPDYAKWQIEDPRVNFAISARGAPPGLDHLGVQAESAEELAELKSRLDAAQLASRDEAAVACCYARSDKHWAQDPSGIAWESFHTLDTVPTFNETGSAVANACCAPTAAAVRIDAIPVRGKSCC